MRTFTCRSTFLYGPNAWDWPLCCCNAGKLFVPTVLQSAPLSKSPNCLVMAPKLYRSKVHKEYCIQTILQKYHCYLCLARESRIFCKSVLHGGEPQFIWRRAILQESPTVLHHKAQGALQKCSIWFADESPLYTLKCVGGKPTNFPGKPDLFRKLIHLVLHASMFFKISSPRTITVYLVGQLNPHRE
jgi:hypothetical protein